MGERLERVVSSRPQARAYRMRAVGGRVERRALATSYLGVDGSTVAPELAAPLAAASVA